MRGKQGGAVGRKWSSRRGGRALGSASPPPSPPLRSGLDGDPPAAVEVIRSESDVDVEEVPSAAPTRTRNAPAKRARMVAESTPRTQEAPEAAAPAASQSAAKRGLRVDPKRRKPAAQARAGAAAMARAAASLASPAAAAQLHAEPAAAGPRRAAPKAQAVRVATQAAATAAAAAAPSAEDEAVAAAAVAGFENADNAADEDEDADEVLVGHMQAEIVGVRYYSGVVLPGENTELVREPHNPYDRNAIRVNNVLGDQVGHVPRTVAAVLAGYVDRREVRIEGVIRNAGNRFTMPMWILFYTSAGLEAALLRRLQKSLWNGVREGPPPDELPSLPPPSRGRSGSWTEDSPNVTTRALNRDAGAELSGRAADSFFSTERFAELTPVDPPVGILRVELLPHQKIGLRWLLESEHPAMPRPGHPRFLWEATSNGRFRNMATNSVVSSLPPLPRGGLLADDMGMGKTLQCLAMVMSPSDGALLGPRGPATTLAYPGAAAASTDFCDATLVVTAVSVMRNWADQAVKLTTMSEDDVVIYHGASRDVPTSALRERRLVIASFDGLAGEHARLGARAKLHSIPWRRVILDEAHLVRNAKSRRCVAVLALMAERRWSVTGTPVQNKVDDLFGPLFAFVGVRPFNEIHWFKRTFSRTLAARQRLEVRAPAMKLLRAALHDLCLRRVKNQMINGEPVLRLPPKTTHVVEFDLDSHEREFYDCLVQETKEIVDMYRQSDPAANSFVYIVEVLLRLRQSCNHIGLVGPERRAIALQRAKERSGGAAAASSASYAQPAIDYNSPKVQALLAHLLEHADDECSICLEQMVHAIITMCGHMFCCGCVTTFLTSQESRHLPQTCPLCRETISAATLVQVPAGDMALLSDDTDEAAASGGAADAVRSPSSKARCIISFLRGEFRAEPGVKIVIFSQWTTFLNLLAGWLVQEGIQYVQLTGKMSRTARETSVDLFQSPTSGVQVILISLTAGGLGLTLTAASRVVLCDSWFNPLLEAQAIDRVHRIGQAHPVRIVRFVARQSIEARVLAIQAEKLQLADDALRSVAALSGAASSAVRSVADRMKEIDDLLNSC